MGVHVTTGYRREPTGCMTLPRVSDSGPTHGVLDMICGQDVCVIRATTATGKLHRDGCVGTSIGLQGRRVVWSACTLAQSACLGCGGSLPDKSESVGGVGFGGTPWDSGGVLSLPCGTSSALNGRGTRASHLQPTGFKVWGRV